MGDVVYYVVAPWTTQFGIGDVGFRAFMKNRGFEWESANDRRPDYLKTTVRPDQKAAFKKALEIAGDRKWVEAIAIPEENAGAGIELPDSPSRNTGCSPCKDARQAEALKGPVS